VAERSGDTAFARARHEQTIFNPRPHESGVSRTFPGFPPQSKTSRDSAAGISQSGYGLFEPLASDAVSGVRLPAQAAGLRK